MRCEYPLRECILKILHVVPSYLPAIRYGGPIYTVHGLCRALIDRNHDVHVFTTNVDGRSVSDVPTNRPVSVNGVSVNYFPTSLGRRIYRSPAMGQALKEKCKVFDIVHLHSVFLWPTMAAGKVAREAKIPYVVTPRGMLVRELITRKSCFTKHAWLTLFERRNIEQASAIHFTSQIEAEEMRLLGIKFRRCAIIQNGLDPIGASVETSADDLAWIQSLPQPFILYLGRINWKKGLDRLIAAMADVESVCLLIAGNDEEGYQQTVVSLANQRGVAQKIQFVGFVEGARKWSLLRRAQILLLPSYSENFGMVVLEAMSAGCPVIVTSEVGMAHTVKTSGAGLVVKGDPDALAAAITQLMNNECTRKKMGEAGRKTARDHFSWASVATRMESLYTECVESGGGHVD